MLSFHFDQPGSVDEVLNGLFNIVFGIFTGVLDGAKPNVIQIIKKFFVFLTFVDPVFNDSIFLRSCFSRKFPDNELVNIYIAIQNKLITVVYNQEMPEIRKTLYSMKQLLV